VDEERVMISPPLTGAQLNKLYPVIKTKGKAGTMYELNDRILQFRNAYPDVSPDRYLAWVEFQKKELGMIYPLDKRKTIH
jgi:hypothetical protein